MMALIALTVLLFIAFVLSCFFLGFILFLATEWC